WGRRQLVTLNEDTSYNNSARQGSLGGGRGKWLSDGQGGRARGSRCRPYRAVTAAAPPCTGSRACPGKLQRKSRFWTDCQDQRRQGRCSLTRAVPESLPSSRHGFDSGAALGDRPAACV